jgi:hypothetical protein
VIVICCESEVDGRFSAFVHFTLDAFVLSHAILLENARDTFQFQESLGTDRIARLFDIFPVGKLSELSTTSERVWIHRALASFKQLGDCVRGANGE